MSRSTPPGDQLLPDDLAVPGFSPMRRDNRTVVAMAKLSLEESADDAKQAPALALAHARLQTLPPKVAKAKKG
jgi:hypothetical protein